MGRMTGAWLVAWVLGCGGAGVRSEGQAPLAARYPAHRYLVGEGMSRAGRAEAEAQARARVSEQIRAEVSSRVKEVSGIEGGREFQRILNEVQVRAEFRHAELIEVSSEPGRDREGVFRAVAVLERSKAVSVLMDEYRRESQRFRLEVGRAVQARGNAVRFTAPFRQAEEAFSRLAEDALQVRVIAGSGTCPKEFEADSREFTRLQEARAEVMSALKVTVLPGDIEPPAARERVVQALTGALASLGLVTVAEGVCRGGYALVPEARLGCTTSFVGVKCDVTLKGRVTDCATGSEVAPLALGGAGSGAHPKEPDIARSMALGAVNARDLAPRLREALKTLFPLP